jgi:predicted  nucleic acid-binding Zn-ribbon protein
MRAGWPGLALLLAGCAASGGWSKTGVDSAAAAREYQDCRATAESAVKTDADIDQDIRATRRSDWQRSASVRTETQTMQEHTSGRANAITAACMHAKGFAEPR